MHHISEFLETVDILVFVGSWIEYYYNMVEYINKRILEKLINHVCCGVDRSDGRLENEKMSPK